MHLDDSNGIGRVSLIRPVQQVLLKGMHVLVLMLLASKETYG